jgi:hypothetical protein
MAEMKKTSFYKKQYHYDIFKTITALVGMLLAIKFLEYAVYGLFGGGGGGGVPSVLIRG